MEKEEKNVQDLKNDDLKSNQKEKEHCWKILFFVVLFISFCTIAGFWIHFVLFRDLCFCKAILPNCVFLSLLIILSVFAWKVFCKTTEYEEKKNEIDRKMEFEKFQNNLYKARHESTKIEELDKKVSDLEKKFNDSKDTNVIEREKYAQAFLLLALGYSSQNVFSDSRSIEDKLKQIEKDYKLLKNKVINIKL